MINLSALDKYITRFKPSNIESIYYLFLDKGVDFNSFNNLPIPYIISMLNTHTYIKEEESKANKKATRR